MTDSLEALRNRADGATDLQGVVRTMKAISASNITQYENAVKALHSYYETIQQGLVGCLKYSGKAQFRKPLSKNNVTLHSVMTSLFLSNSMHIGQL